MTSVWPRRRGDLLLRDATPDDLDGLIRLRNDPGVNRWMMRTHVSAEDLRREWLGAPSSPVNHSCLVEVDGQVAAMAFLELIDHGIHPETPRGVDGLIGYIVDPAFAGRGIATEATRELLDVAFGTLGLRRIRAYCNRDNPASARVMEKAGMRREEHGVEDSWHAERGWVDGYGYAVLATEWRGEASGLPQLVDSAAPVPLPRPLPPALTGSGWPRRSGAVELAPVAEADLPEILVYRKDPRTTAWLLRPRLSLDELRESLLGVGPDTVVLVGRVDGRAVGHVTLHRRDGQGQPDGPVAGCEAELGIVVAPDAARQGIGRALVAAGLDLAFAELGVRRVTAGLYADNLASAGLMRSLGMRLEQHGVLDSWHHDHGWVDGMTFGLLAREWRGCRSAAVAG